MLWVSAYGLPQETNRSLPVDTHARSKKTRRHPAVDEAFLAQIESCWAALATGAARRHANLPLVGLQRTARQVVQLVVFLGLCRRRGLLACRWFDGPISGSGILRRLCELRDSLEDRYGSGLFRIRSNRGARPEKDELATLPIGDEPLRQVLSRLGQPLAALSGAGGDGRVLGHIHARLLGRRLRRTAAGIEVCRSAAANKAGGVFYTPEYITRYIVQHAIGSRLEDEPGSAAADFGLAILDPACGCGWFLLEAYRHLLAWCRRRHVPGAPRIVAQHLHGVDVDPEAVLAARRALWLEMASGETEPDRRGILDDLSANLRCGDALVGPVLEHAAGRFDVVLGNPPYRRELNTKHLLDRIAATRFGRRYRAPRMDLWYYFVHRGLELLKPGGRLSFIVGSYWTSGRGAEKLIRALRETTHVEEIFCLDRLNVFPNVAGRHMILSLTKGPGRGPTTVKRAVPGNRTDAEPFVCGRAPVVVFRKTPEQLFRGTGIDLEPPADELLAKLARWTPLAVLGTIRQGIVENPAAVTRKAIQQHGSPWQVGEGVFALTPAELARLKLPEVEKRLIRPYHDLCDLGRYFLAEEPSLRLIYSTRATCPDIDAYPMLRSHLARFRPILETRRETRNGTRPWWQLHWPREERLWLVPKIISVQMARRPAFVPAAGPVYVPFSTNVFVPAAETREHLNYFAALLNSRLLWRWYRHHAKRRGVGLEINGHVLSQTPIRTIDFTNPADKSRHDELVNLVDQMLTLSRRLRTAKTKRQITAIERALENTDRQIDESVYSLYNCTADEFGVP